MSVLNSPRAEAWIAAQGWPMRGTAMAAYDAIVVGACCAVMRQVTDQPVTEHAGNHPGADSPEDKSDTTSAKKEDRPGCVLHHPRAFEELVEAIFENARLDPDVGWAGQYELAVDLPPRIAKRRASMPQVIVATRQPLREIAQLMLTEQFERAGETNLHAAIDQYVFEPSEALKAVVNEFAVAAEGMAKQQNDGGG